MTAEPIGKILVRSGTITEQQLAEGLTRQVDTDRYLGDVLTEIGFTRDEDIAKALAVQLHIPYFELGEEFVLERDEIGLVPETVARRFGLVPHRNGRREALFVIMGNPLDVEAVDTVRQLSGLEIRKAVGTPARIQAVMDRYYREDAYIERNLQELIDVEADAPHPATGEADPEDADQLRLVANDAPVVRFVNLILMEAVRDRASDIHFEPGEKEVRVRLRVDGVLRETTTPPKRLYSAIVTRIKILSDMDIAEHRLPLDGRFKFQSGGHHIDVRVSSLPEVYGEKLVLRILDQDAVLLDMAKIGFEGALLERFQRILRLPHGILLLTGPTGSGKTTTLYSALAYLKSPKTNIQTVEDPVEYLLPGINQMQMKPAIGLDFAHALRSILRQDPDIILVGEIRDVETARIAIRASLTGHLVLSTLHTNDATSAFNRLRDIGIEPYLIAASVKLVIAQRLIRLLCDDCKTPVKLPAEELATVRAICPDADGWTFYQPTGCRHCGHTGFRGRKGVFEFLEVTEPLREMIANVAADVDVRQRAVELGMETLGASGFHKVRQGVTTVEEVLAVWEMEQTN